MSFEGQDVLETEYPSPNQTGRNTNGTFITMVIGESDDEYEDSSSSSSNSDGDIKVEIVKAKIKKVKKP